MAVTPHDLMKGAERISQDISETGRRNVASRAYYAAYHACLPIAERMGLTAMPSNSKHASVIHTLSASRKTKALGYILRAMRTLRNWADYELEIDFPEEDGRNAVMHGKKVLAKTQALGSSP